MGDIAYTLTLMGLLGGGVAVARIALWLRDRVTHRDLRHARPFSPPRVR